MSEDAKIEEVSVPTTKTTRKRTTKKVEKAVVEYAKAEVPEVIKEPEIKTHKIYAMEVHVNDPLPQANDITVDIVVGNVTYDEATDMITTASVSPKYEAMFNHFDQMSYYIETDDAPLLMSRSLGKDWALNLPNAIPASLTVNEARGVRFFATKAQIANEEPI